MYSRIYLLSVALPLCCYAWAFSSCSRLGLLSAAVRGLLIAWFLLVVAEHQQALGVKASVVVAHRLSCSVACDIFLDR